MRSCTIEFLSYIHVLAGIDGIIVVIKSGTKGIRSIWIVIIRCVLRRDYNIVCFLGDTEQTNVLVVEGAVLVLSATHSAELSTPLKIRIR